MVKVRITVKAATLRNGKRKRKVRSITSLSTSLPPKPKKIFPVTRNTNASTVPRSAEIITANTLLAR